MNTFILNYFAARFKTAKLALMCLFLASTTLGFSAPIIDSIVVTPQVCTGTSTGSSITVYATGTNLKYSVTGPQNMSPQVSNSFNDLASGTYTVTVIGNSGTTLQTGVIIDDISSNLLLPTITSEPPFCPGESDAYIVVTANGGQAPYFF